MTEKQKLNKIKQLIRRSKTALIISHVDPDGDSIGSALALYLALRKFNIHSKLFCKSPISQIYKWMPSVARFTNIIPKGKFDLAFTLDCGAEKRVGIHAHIHKNAKYIINIDHHPDNTKYGDLNLVEAVTSAAELTYRLIKYLKIKITPQIATCLHTAIITDTGNFRYESTTPYIFEVAAEMLRAGAHPFEIAREIYESRSLEAIKLLGLALHSIETYLGGKLALVAISNKQRLRTAAKDEDFAGIVEFLRSIAGVEVGVSIRETEDNKVKVNFRSKKYVNVSRLAKKLGGGGHKRSSGAVLENNLTAVKNKVIELVKKAI
jgi:phosphoesterase RecJ-like protein